MKFPYGRPHTPDYSATTPALTVKEVAAKYPSDNTPAIHDISFTLLQGEKVALIGPNGAGKSTLMKAIVGQVRDHAGQIEVYGCGVKHAHALMAYLPQRTEIHWHFPVTVYDAVMMGRYVHLGWIKRPAAPDHTSVQRAIEQLDLVPLSTRLVSELSGGQQQRVMLARALAQEASLLLLDEPFNNVDAASQEVIYTLMERLTQEGKTVLVSTHDLASVPQQFHRVILMDKTVLADGNVHEVINPDVLAKIYGFTPALFAF